MSKAKMGASVVYCGHAAIFVADIWELGGVNVVVANGPIKDQLIYDKKAVKNATHHLSDFPKAGYWGAERGIFVVPGDQVTVLKNKNKG